jgi:3D (Asp-Asp-Asp) domain-containing protein
MHRSNFAFCDDGASVTSRGFSPRLWYGHAALRSPGQSLLRPLVAALGLAAALLVASVASADLGELRQHGHELATRTQAAVVDLYVLDSKLARAQEELAGVEARVAALERERREARLELRAARRTLAVAQRSLGGQVRVLYEHDQPDVLAIIFGARSLEEVITGLDNLSRTAGATNLVIAQTRSARARVTRLSRSLARRHDALERLRAAASARAAALESARIERQAYLGRLREDRRLNAAQIAHAQLQARAAQAASRAATMVAESAGSVASIAAQPLLPADPPVRPASGNRLTVLATAYSLPGSTASGLPTGPGIVAVDPTVIPLGTRMTVPGYGEAVAADVGTAIKGLRIDVWFPTLAQAQAWGLRSVTITLH